MLTIEYARNIITKKYGNILLTFLVVRQIYKKTMMALLFISPRLIKDTLFFFPLGE